MTGYRYNVLRVDLNSGLIGEEIPPKEWYHQYLGGKGLGYRYLAEEVDPQIDPLAPENEILLMSGPLAGTLIPTSSRLAVVTKSPLTGTILVSLVGGSFAAELKYAGYDGIVIMGKAARPVCLVLDNGKYYLRNAAELWGKGIFETEHLLRESLGDEFKIISVGPAGENLVRYACLSVDSYHQAGRGGAGAVFGSKNLKAIAVRGNKGIKVANGPEILNYIYELRQNDVLTPQNLWTNWEGTPQVVEISNRVGILPTKNFQDGVYEKAELINADAVKANLKAKRGCFSCPLACGKFTKKGDLFVEGPEYETIAMAGSNCDLGDIPTLMEFNRYCDDLGLDSMSTGAVIGFAMEATEKNLFDFGIQFGAKEKCFALLQDIVYQRGMGSELSQGVRYLAGKYQLDAIAMEVKGLELPGYDPRGSYGQALAYATNDRGGCHQRAFPAEEDAFGMLDPFTWEGKAELVLKAQDFISMKDSLVLCDFWRPSLSTITKIVNMFTEADYSEEELMRVGERIWNVGRLFNVLAGFRKKDDCLPKRVLYDKLPHGSAAGREFPVEEFKLALNKYYELRQWSNEGIPTKEKLTELGIDDLLTRGMGKCV